MLKTVVKLAGFIGTQQLPHIISLEPADYGRILEPFGGPACFSINHPDKERIIIDSNQNIVDVHNAVKSYPEEFIAEEKNFQEIYNALPNLDTKRLCYIEARNLLNSPEFIKMPLAKRAAIFFGITRLSFNGLYRVNSHGKFNVPFGNKETFVCDENAIRDVNAAMGSLSISLGSYSDVVNLAQPNDFVLMNMPPLSGSKNAIKEAGSMLVDVFKALTEMGVHVMLVTADNDNIRALLETYNVNIFSTKTTISAKAGGRGSKSTLIITNYSCPASR